MSGGLRKRPFDSPTAQGESTDGARLSRSLGRIDLLALGVGAIVGAGIFVTTGVAAATKAGPAIVLSFLLAGGICLLVALCYSELASMTPASGSAYTYTYSSMGEQAAFFVGWNLLLELVVAASAVAIGWSGLFTAMLDSLFGWELPEAITAGPWSGGVINLPAVVILVIIAGILAVEVKLTARVTKTLVVLTISVLLLVCIVGAPHIETANWEPFAPWGMHGIAAGAAMAFFAFIGFDIVATSAEEARNPRRDLPWGIIGSIVIATILYAGVAAVLTGVAPYASLNNEAPVATALKAIGAGWIGNVILVASVIALTKGLLVIVYGQTRMVFAMCRDAMLPQQLAVTNVKGAPVRLAVVLGTVCATIAGLFSIDVVAELVNIGALTAFVAVAAGVVVLRFTEPDRRRDFRVPLGIFVPLLAIAGCVWMASTLTGATWIRFIAWSVAGIALYLAYGRRRSLIPTGEGAMSAPESLVTASESSGAGSSGTGSGYSA